MSVQIALLAPATRVASLKLGPDGRQPARSLGGEQALRLGHQQVREHVREVGDAAPSAGRGSRRLSRRAAPRGSRAAGAGARRAPRRFFRAPASGTRSRPRRGPRGRARPRSSRPRRADGRRRSAHPRRRRPPRAWWSPRRVTTQSGPGGSRAPARRRSASAPTGAATNTTSAPCTACADVRRLLVDRARAQRAGAHALVRVVAADPRAGRAHGRPARSIRPIRPSPRIATLNGYPRAPVAPPRAQGRPPSDGAERLACEGGGPLDRAASIRRSPRTSAPGARRRSPRRGSGAPRR